jgi:2-oxo-4-hydroxy-4-carboxy-5-ureidoimidazoline decarboxylase
MADFPITLYDANRLDEDAFVDAFGDVAEHAPWVAAEAAERRPFSSRAAMIEAFAKAVRQADKARQRALLLAHPDLAGRATIADDLTRDSKSEQAAAGLDKLTPAQFRHFTEQNTSYRERHGIPFILAVRGATAHDIMKSFHERIDNAQDVEFKTALEQVERIIRFRLEDRVTP